jgi:hypothetical protein
VVEVELVVCWVEAAFVGPPQADNPTTKRQIAKSVPVTVNALRAG